MKTSDFKNNISFARIVVLATITLLIITIAGSIFIYRKSVGCRAENITIIKSPDEIWTAEASYLDCFAATATSVTYEVKVIKKKYQ